MSKADNHKNFALAGAVVIGIVTFWGAWTRRWMSDDGLIVLRTVRNLLAGNGPVFNAGERVEANTSTIWQYLIYLGAKLTGAQLEYIAMWLAIVLSVAATVIAALATPALYRRTTLIPTVPFGLVIYLALPPARDFFTSGLEWGLSLFYLAVLWALLLRWALPQLPVQRSQSPLRSQSHEREDGAVTNTETDATMVFVPQFIKTRADKTTLALAFWCGLSWLVRPEFALYGGIIGLILLFAHPRLSDAAKILAVALPLPLGYQIFRMGYYGLLTPHTAVAKSAAGSEWKSGLNYLADLAVPYALWLPLLIAAIIGIHRVFAPGAQGITEAPVRSRTTAVAAILLCGLLHLIYVVKVGGDFMHGRMLLLPLFALLLPIAVIPVRHMLDAIAITAVAVWAMVVAFRGNNNDWSQFDSGEPLRIVDEREFWTYSTKQPRGTGPLTAEDYLDMRILNGYQGAVGKLQEGDAWAYRYITDKETREVKWVTVPRENDETPPTIYIMNLGMSSMNAPLDVRILDPIGLATPISARQPRLEDARIGHDKMLPYSWQAATTSADIEELPSWMEPSEARLARQALEQEPFQELFASYREPMSVDRFLRNLEFSLTDGRTLELSKDPREYVAK